MGSSPVHVKVSPKRILLSEEALSKVPATIVLKSGDEIHTEGLAYAVFKAVEALSVKADRAY